MFGNVVFLDFFMPRRCCVCCWSVVTRSMQSCRACVWFRCGVVSCRVLFHHCGCSLRGDASLRIGSWIGLQSSMRQCGERQCWCGVAAFPLAPRHAFVCWVVSSHVVWPETRLAVISFPSVEPCRCVLVLWRRLVGLTVHRCCVDPEP